VAWWLRHLSLAQLYAATVIEGALFVFHHIVHQSVLPSIVSREQLAAPIALLAALAVTLNGDIRNAPSTRTLGRMP